MWVAFGSSARNVVPVGTGRWRLVRAALVANAALIVLLSAATANADGYSSGSAYVAPFSWTGFYGGLNAGYGSSRTSVGYTGDEQDTNSGPGSWFLNATFTNSLNILSNAGFTSNAYSQSIHATGFVGGGQLGYNLQFARHWVAGFEADIQSGVGGTTSTTRTPL